jgi:hypothetical protein
MARPRIFISSTYYDLKHIRASLENFVESLGYDAILSERGNIAYDPQVALDESCYREAGNAHVFVLIIGGRYGSETSATKTDDAKKKFYDEYDSITKKEYTTAVSNGVPVYILIERAVYADYETYLLNKDSATIQYAHVNSVNVFIFIEEILAKRCNNPFQLFDRFADIQAWLKEQWAGLFREFLTRKSAQQQLVSLTKEVATLTDINTTLKNYLEQVVKKVSPENAQTLIESEEKRLNEAANNWYLSTLIDNHPFIRGLGWALPTNHSLVHLACCSDQPFDKMLDHLKLAFLGINDAHWDGYLANSPTLAREFVEYVRSLHGVLPLALRKNNHD